MGSDHLPIQVAIDIQPVRSEIIIRKKWKVTEENLSNFSKGILPSKLCQPNDINSIAEDFSERLKAAAGEYIGKTSGKLVLRKSAIWWDMECDLKIAEVRRARRKLIKYPTQLNIDTYKSISKDFAKLKITKRKESFEKFISDIKHDTPPGEIWKKIKGIKGYNVIDNGPLEKGGTILVDPASKANYFADHLKSISSKAKPNHVIVNFEDLLSTASEINEDEYNNDITFDEMISALHTAKSSSSPGIDDIPYKLLKSLGQVNLEELLGIYNQSFKSGTIPDSWKEGLVLPIPKPGKPKNLVTSYRPIALLSCMGKTLERIIKNRLEFIVEKQNLLLPSQCGFRRGQSSQDVLLRLENNIRDALNTKQICFVA